MRSVYLLILTFTINSVYGQKTRELFYGDVLYGKVKQVLMKEYANGSAMPELKDTTWYDEKGSTLENHRKSTLGTLQIEKYKYSNDAAGKNIGIINSSKDQNISAKLDNNGNITEYVSFFKVGRPNFRSTYEYDGRNNLIKFQFLDKGIGPATVRTYKYDKNDLLVEQDFWKQDGTLNYHVTFKYSDFDNAGNWLTRTSQKMYASGKALPGITIVREILYY
jgi:hypothetical protein